MRSGPRRPGEGTWPTNTWGQHVSGSTSEWTCLFPDNVLPLENVWLPWQLPSQWHSWSPPLTATIRSPSSTPKPTGRDLVSIFPQVISLCAGRRAPEGRPCRQGAVACSTATWHALRGLRSRLDVLHVSILLGKWAWASPLLLLDLGFFFRKMRKPQVLLSALGLLLLPPGDVMFSFSPGSAEGQVCTNNLLWSSCPRRDYFQGQWPHVLHLHGEQNIGKYQREVKWLKNRALF